MSLLHLLQLPHYASDATKFLDQLKKDKPEIARQQLVGRSLLWDRQIDRDALAEYKAARVPQKSYVYQTDH